MCCVKLSCLLNVGGWHFVGVVCRCLGLGLHFVTCFVM